MNYTFIESAGLYHSGSNSERYLEVAQNIYLRGTGVTEFLPTDNFDDPNGILLMNAAAMSARVFGPSFTSYAITGTFFYILFVVCLALLGWQTGSAWTGAIAAAIGGLLPAVYGHSLVFNLDLSVAAMTLLSLVLLLQTRRFSRSVWSVMFGVVAGLAIWAKISAPFCIGPAMVACFSFGLLQPRDRDACPTGVRVLNFLSALLALAAVTLLRGGLCLLNLWQRWTSHLSPGRDEPFHDLLGHHTLELVYQTFGPVLLVLIAAAVPLFIYRKGCRHAATITAFFLPSLLLFFYKPESMHRFALANLGALAVLAAAAITVTRKRQWVNAALVLVIVSASLANLLTVAGIVTSKYCTRTQYAPRIRVLENYDTFLHSLDETLPHEKDLRVVSFRPFDQLPRFPGHYARFVIRSLRPHATVYQLDNVRSYKFFDLAARHLHEADFLLVMRNTPKWDWPVADLRRIQTSPLVYGVMQQKTDLLIRKLEEVRLQWRAWRTIETRQRMYPGRLASQVQGIPVYVNVYKAEKPTASGK
ncbi:MAG: hypothetical protein P9L99_10685 [Candidatus Lernaella stagnicola]|nr:hypothetical protein [Candidatus Lernaella stagnicola]